MCEFCGMPVLEALVLDGSGSARIATTPATANWAAVRIGESITGVGRIGNPSNCRTDCQSVLRPSPTLIDSAVLSCRRENDLRIRPKDGEASIDGNSS